MTVTDEIVEQIGSLEEAKELYSAIGGRTYTARMDGPEGWEYLGSGGTRACWLSPAGIAYKVCHRYFGTRPSSNEVEHKNFTYIRKGKKLKAGWSVPRSSLYEFTGKYDGDANHRITVLACDYVEGSTWDTSYEDEMEQVMNSVGLTDCFRGNAMKALDGSKWIVDAAENLIPSNELE